MLLPGVLMTRVIRRRCGSLWVPVPPTKTSIRERWQPEYRLYRGTRARSLVPMYALTLLLIAGIAQPYLARQERQAYQQDRVFFVHPGETVPPLEAQIVNDLKRAMLRDIG